MNCINGCLREQGAEDEEQEDARVHVLAPFTQNVNSIKRHVRTRIYFTSESHIHSLMNILRHTDLEGRSLLSEDALQRFDEAVEFDYLTQIVFRLYECNNVRPSLCSPFPRFLLHLPHQIFFSGGCALLPVSYTHLTLPTILLV